ncbi:citrate (Si)-synthase [Desulfuromonas acetoxidans]|uniref:citrate synthase (unknown stereospecificity) n=2 Tax=Desulfuromonas acetoxidans TaxID=891 RepID=Q1JY49_DESA6|nr:citrate (Si)-synthase [Desulfuromonas acetoxidans]AAS67337.1 citrate synthase [Desulfuromonas acetoxidans]EAT15147.1 Citrate (Si)-synthase [Desulfuromonas acetoxidans DSM 684]MBF0643974.1 citrate (Si)-synthase [Desulfuromonas acetoxidans]NVD23212.1 citrate (Si)-synthase [Desulfuromonas acetoxidans]NVE15547.1 citrate (Si)-synthase [Desulfuromonas acetoxidans]
MSTLKEVLKQKIDAHRPRTTRLVKECGDTTLGEVTIAQAIGGARGIKCLVTDISYLDPMEGIRFRGMTIPETFAALPKVPGSDYPYVEGFWYLLLTGDVPTMEQTLEVVEDWKQRSQVPEYVIDVLRAMPRDSHPMAMFSAAIVAMQRDSVFASNYAAGKFNKMTCWEDMLEDSNDLMAKLGPIAAYIYRMKYKGDTHIAPDPELDMGGQFAHLIGQCDEYKDVARMYFILHSDHESGNVSAHTTHLVASALSDAYYSYAAGINGLAGPLHGLANQEVLAWTQNFMEKLGGKVPTKDELKAALWDTLNSGQVIPGYGHAVLRKTDPRYTSQREFCLNTPGLKEDPLFQLVAMIYEVAPDVLLEHGKAKNPWPNVDAQSGVIQWYYGLTEYDFYTVLFGVGRALGCLANITWDRALGYAIERPKSVTTAMLEDAAGIK